MRTGIKQLDLSVSMDKAKPGTRIGIVRMPCLLTGGVMIGYIWMATQTIQPKNISKQRSGETAVKE
jgi:hypothetical protein